MISGKKKKYVERFWKDIKMRQMLKEYKDVKWISTVYVSKFDCKC